MVAFVFVFYKMLVRVHSMFAHLKQIKQENLFRSFME